MVLAGASLLRPKQPQGDGGPHLRFVAPQPGAKLAIREAPIALHLGGATLRGRYTLTIDGRYAASGQVAPVVRYLPPPLAPGGHRLQAYVYGPGYAWTYEWNIQVAHGAVSTLRPVDKTTQRALEDVNGVRALGGLRPLGLAWTLEGAARAHSSFFARNVSRYGSSLSVSVHSEQPGWPGFVGRDPYSRDVAFGFNGDGDSEVMAFGAPVDEAIALWVDSIYHRFGLVDPGLTEMGFGIAGSAAQSADLPVTTIDAGYYQSAEVRDSVPVLWPPPGLVGVPLAFEEGEIPDPLANFQGARYPAGYPVTISFFGAGVKELRIDGATLTAKGEGIAAYLLTQQSDANPEELGNSAALIPKAPLKAGTVYRAAFRGRYRDAGGWHPFDRETTFSTAAPPTLADEVPVQLGRPGAGIVTKGRMAGNVIYMPISRLVAPFGGHVLWTSANPDFVTASLGGRTLRFSYRSFSARSDGREVVLPMVPASPGPDPYVPAKAFARLLGLPLQISVSRT